MSEQTDGPGVIMATHNSETGEARVYVKYRTAPVFDMTDERFVGSAGIELFHRVRDAILVAEAEGHRSGLRRAAQIVERAQFKIDEAATT